MAFAPGCFWSPYSWPTFLSIFLWSPLGKISKNGRFRCPCQHCHNSAIRTLMERQFAAKYCPMFALQVHTKYEMLAFAPGWFRSPYSRPTFLSVFPWSPLGKISENGRFRCPFQHCYNSAIRTLMERQFAAKCCPIFALEMHTTVEMMAFAPGCFSSPYSRATFLSIFPWSPFGKISENGRFRCPCQHCHNSAIRTLMERQFAAKFVLCLHFKCILIRRWWYLRQGVFEAPIVGLLFWAFSLGPPWQNLRKWPI